MSKNLKQVDQALNDVLVTLFNKIMTIESKAVINGEFSNISVNDMHIIETIGIGTEKRVTDTAKSLGITAGTVNVAMNSLESKGYINRNRSETDKRVVLVSLTEKGERAYKHHEEFHTNMIKSIITNFNPDDRGRLATSLSNLVTYFETVEALSTLDV